MTCSINTQSCLQCENCGLSEDGSRSKGRGFYLTSILDGSGVKAT